MDPLIGSALVSGGASLLGGLFGRKKSEPKPDYEGQLKYIPREIQAKVQGAKAAGLHPLAAIGMSTSQAPVIPGQTSTGSIVGDAIQAGAGGYAAAQQREYNKQMGELGLEKARLENKWLETQIANSQMSLAKQSAIPYPESYRRARLTRDPVLSQTLNRAGQASQMGPRIPASVKADMTPRLGVDMEGNILEYPKGTAMEREEEEHGEWSQWMPRQLERAWENWKRQFKQTDTWRNFKKFAKMKYNIDFDRQAPKWQRSRPYNKGIYTQPYEEYP